jgi:hypothetical protein
LVLLAFIALLALVSPLVSKAYAAGVYSLSVKQGGEFVSRLKSSADELALFSEGSRQAFEVKPATVWRLRGGGQELELIVLPPEGLAGTKEKSFLLRVGGELAFFDAGLEGETLVRLEKSQGEIVVNLEARD